MSTVNMLDAKTHLSRLVQQVETGEESEIVIARTGRPVARLVPMKARSRLPRRLGQLAGRYPRFTLGEFDATNEEIARLFGGNP